MAVYEYRCEECEILFTVSETITRHESHKATPECPECGAKKTVQLLSGFFAKTKSKT